MNAKAERIDQIIQIVNRNLLLIFAGQPEGVTPLDSRNLQRIDVNVFGGDKFAYEMVNFVKTSPKITSTSLAAQWDRNFLKGLETLIVECAVVKDEVERECFVSRVYVWFSDKLAERRDLPMHIMGKEEIKSLTDIISNVGGKHTVKALENYSASIPNAQVPEEEPKPAASTIPPPRDADMTLPALRRRSQQPVYVQHTYPSLFEAVPSYMNNPDDTFGLMNYNPETEAEKVMNELWIARRRQEAFEYKAQQNIALIMDRRALNKSRLESEALRRAETSTFLANQNDAPVNYDTATKFAPKIQRPLSGRRQYNKVMNYSETEESNAKIVVAKGSSKVEANVQSTNRLVVEKPAAPKKEILPMKFKMEWPDSVKDRKMSKDDTNLSTTNKDDSDDEKPVVRSRPHSTQPARSKASAATPLRSRVVNLAADKPHSAHQMRNMARTDGEYQVHYKFSTLRRMPYTPEMRAWVDKREEQRVKKEKEYEKRLIEAEAENGGKGKGGKGDKKNTASAKPSKKTIEKPPAAPKPKYSSAADFMEQHFPKFDSDMYSQGPYRRHQLLEVSRVYDALSEYYPNISEETIKKALVVPQDRPESICLENLKDSLEGLMENPLPVEFWRKCVTDVPEVKKKKKGKKKKE